MKALPYVLLVLVLGVALYEVTRRDTQHATLIAENRQFLAERDSALRIINEHADSAKAILPRIEWRERVVTRLVTRTDTLRMHAGILADSGQWEAAYRTRTQEADTLRLALQVATKRGDEAIQMASYWQLAYIADSSRREEAEQRLAHTTDVLAKRSPFWKRFGIDAGVSIPDGKAFACACFRIWPAP